MAAVIAAGPAHVAEPARMDGSAFMAVATPAPDDVHGSLPVAVAAPLPDRLAVEPDNDGQGEDYTESAQFVYNGYKISGRYRESLPDARTQIVTFKDTFLG